MSDYQYIDTTGIIVADTSDILTQVQTEWQTSFGPDLIVTPDTPQGVMITAETVARTNVIDNNAALANQINPNLAGGVFLDAVCALTALNRIAATPSVVVATLSGVAGTAIPAGTRAQTLVNDVFATTGSVVIGGGGTVDATFQSVELGPIPCATGALSQIVDGVLGWETVTNASGATVGQNTQSDQSLRALRKVTLATQGVALVEAQVSALYQVEGVKSLTFQENIAATTQTINTISMVAHSVYACVDGGADLDVATSLLANKSSGSAWNGGTSVAVVEPYSGQSYTVLFDRPTPVSFKLKAYVSNSDLLIDATTAVTAAILNYVAGGIEGIPGLTVGTDISCFELAGAIISQYPNISVSNLTISTDGGTTYTNTTVSIEVNEIGTISASDIIVITS